VQVVSVGRSVGRVGYSGSRFRCQCLQREPAETRQTRLEEMIDRYSWTVGSWTVKQLDSRQLGSRQLEDSRVQ